MNVVNKIDRLETDNAVLQQIVTNWMDANGPLGWIDGLRKDAERYRWLHANGLFAQSQGYDTQIGITAPSDPYGILFVGGINTSDAHIAIDAAMTKGTK